MSESFSVGEICILVYSRSFPEYDGQEVVVTGGLEERVFFGDRQDKTIHAATRYRVRASDGMWFCPRPEQLRKKRPPDHPDTKATWDSSPWWPEKLVTELPA